MRTSVIAAIFLVLVAAVAVKFLVVPVAQEAKQRPLTQEQQDEQNVNLTAQSLDKTPVAGPPPQGHDLKNEHSASTK